ncbi:DUF4097 domain-containing protein [Hymenobacter artigasi]|uniref:Adhesin domain-containing protein n=1 Tax=Hymenobacter artigasi TaxID=2719616 RepID=A0ABX1HIH5_9BACT|nr:hypothetical protein [Hymenobacter artigasi]NKI90069.1 hypothetical protein [Hymenobacter artigasi]
MTRPNFLLSLPALLWLCSSPACQAQASRHLQSKEQITKEFMLTAEAGRSTLALYNINGSVTVQGYAGSKVLVEATKTISADDAKTLETGKAEAQLGFAQHGDSVVVYLTGPQDSRPHNNDRRGGDRKEINYRYDFDFVVKVPCQLNVRVSTINHGEVKVQDVTGPLHVFNVNGPITLANVKGSTEARTVNGNVDASYAANPPGASSYHTINGQIRVKYPAGFAADMHFKSMHGEFYTDFPNAEMLPVQVTKNREGHSSGTMYKLTKDTAVRIGQGGPDLHFETLNGDVTVTKQ